MALFSSTFQSLLEEIIKMSECAVMSAEDSMRSAMQAKIQANSALSAARQMMESHQHQLTEREVDGLQSDQVSTTVELDTNTAEHRDWKDADDDDDDETQPVFLSDPTAGIVDGGSDSEVEDETAAIVDVLTSSDESEDRKNDAQSLLSSVSLTDSVFPAVPPCDLQDRPSAVAAQYIPSPIQVDSLLLSNQMV